MIELLAPAGSREAFTAALEAGADAVYLGGRAFGARHYAPNFDDQELAEVVREAHLRGVAVYVTVNILVDNGEIPALVTYLETLYRSGVDAIIIQDLGVAAIARRVVPDLPLHASTQMTVHNLAGVEFLAAHGLRRVVLARELSLQEIRHICQNTSVEVETFIHGALCISYSGQCLMSSLIGGRSGNRGKCAQPCRLPYTLVDPSGKDALAGEDAGEYLLSPKDFNTIEHIPALIEAGVVSFKIEGRMKRAEYVAVVVDSYRRAIDAYLADKANFAVPAGDQKDMAQVFNRGFTDAYLYRKPGRAMMSDRRPNNRGVRIGRVLEYNPRAKAAVIKLDETLHVGDTVEFWVKVGGRSGAAVSSIRVGGKPVESAEAGAAAEIPVEGSVRPGDRVFKTFDSKLMERARTFFTAGAPVRRIPVDVAVAAEEGRPLTVTIRDDEGNLGQGETGFLAAKALNRPLTDAVIAKQVGRLGATPFAMRKLSCAISGQVMVPVSEMNEARRLAVERLEDARLSRYRRPPLPRSDYTTADFLPAAGATSHPQKPRLTVNVDTPAKAEAALANGADLVMFGGDSFQGRPFAAEDYRAVVALARAKGKGVVLSTPRITKEWQMAGLRADLELFRELAPDAVSVGNLGSFMVARQLGGLSLHGDWSLNVFNGAAIRFLAGEGLDSLTLSPELNFGQLEVLAAGSPVALECLVHGYLTLMISEYCALGSFLGGLGAGRCQEPCRKGGYGLKDRMDEIFPVVTDQFCRMHVLNAKELSLLPHVPRFGLLGIDRIRIEGKAASVEHVARITGLYRGLLDLGERHPLLAGEGLKAVEHEDITRGHYFRGVL
ncbi:MAG TPA: DUF3656 domain-containing protein [Selenomonadales bacterium]|nr:DUF3656 domain-containing protein [Selenomonadales bacterium]